MKSFHETTLIVLSIAVVTNAFTLYHPAAITIFKKRHDAFGTGLFMSDDLPSDSSSTETLDVQSEEYFPDENEALVTSVLDDLPETPSFVMNKATRSKINEALLKLEAVNPNKEPTTSPLLNGVWSLKYVGGYATEGAIASPTRQLALFLYSGGYSPGLFGLNIAQSLPNSLVETEEFTLIISREQPRVQWVNSSTVLGGSTQEISAKARMDVESSIRFTEEYESTEVFGNTLEIPTPLRYSRELLVSYLDDDILVLRDATGVPEVYLRKEYGA